MLCIEDMVPQDYMLREIESAIDWNFIYDEVKGLYKETEWGNPRIDPVVLFKIVFIQYLYGIRSMRQTIKKMNPVRTMSFERPCRIANQHKITIRYTFSLTV
jgi:transposase